MRSLEILRVLLTKIMKVRNIFLTHSFYCISYPTFLLLIVSDCELPANIVFVMDESGSIQKDNHKKEVKFVRLVYIF